LHTEAAHLVTYVNYFYLTVMTSIVTSVLSVLSTKWRADLEHLVLYLIMCCRMLICKCLTLYRKTYISK